MGQPFDDVHAVYCYFGSGIILSGVCIEDIFACVENDFNKNIFLFCGLYDS